MRKAIAIAGVSSVLLGLVLATVASAQSREIVFIDMTDVGPIDDGGGADAGDSDARSSASGIVIEGIATELPEPQVEPKPKNARKALQEAIVEHVKYCVGARTVDPSDADTRFLYLVRKGRPNATLSSIENDMGMHVSKLAVDLLRRAGETRPIDVEDQRQIFMDCVEVVPLPERPVVTERLSFHLKAGAGRFIVRDVEWHPL